MQHQAGPREPPVSPPAPSDRSVTLFPDLTNSFLGTKFVELAAEQAAYKGILKDIS